MMYGIMLSHPDYITRYLLTNDKWGGVLSYTNTKFFDSKAKAKRVLKKKTVELHNLIEDGYEFSIFSTFRPC